MGISTQQALDCFASDDLIGIGMEADAVRRTIHPEGVVTYALNAFVSCTGDLPALDIAIQDALANAATGITFVDLFDHGLNDMQILLSHCKAKFPNLTLHSFSVSDICDLAAVSASSVEVVLERLKAAGLDGLACDHPDDLKRSSWIDAHRAAHRAGLVSFASLTFGAGESTLEGVAVLQDLYALQEETGGFQSFRLLSAHSPSGREQDDPTAVEYLKTLSISRMLLDNVPHIVCDWKHQGLKVLQMALRFGSNDTGSILAEHMHAPEEEVRRIIRDAGFRPARRDTLYRSVFLD